MTEDDGVDDFERGLVELLGCRRVDIRDLQPVIEAFDECRILFEKWDGFPKERDKSANYKLRRKNTTGDKEFDGWFGNTFYGKWFAEKQQWRILDNFRSPEYVAEKYAEAVFHFYDDWLDDE